MYEHDHLVDVCDAQDGFAFEGVIDQISRMPWEEVSNQEVLKIAKVYYYFSIQFRENLAIACRLRPQDECLKKLYREECDTDNLSPFPGVTAVGEKINHDEFMRRLLAFQPIQQESMLDRAGTAYLRRCPYRSQDRSAANRGCRHRTSSIRSHGRAAATRWQGCRADRRRQ